MYLKIERVLGFYFVLIGKCLPKFRKIVDSPERFVSEREVTWFLLNVDKYLSVSKRMTVMIS